MDYSLSKAKAIIKSFTIGKVVSAEFGMYEDWCWTSGVIYKNGKFLYEEESPKIRGINGSNWATPCLRLNLESGKCLNFACHNNGETRDITLEEMDFIKQTKGGDYPEGELINF